MVNRIFSIALCVILYGQVFGQFDCGCGNVAVANLTKSSSGPGCSVIMEVKITATAASCVNNSWTWSTSPSGSSGSVYVGWSNGGAVPFTVNSTLNFYMPQSCSSLDGAFVIFDPPSSDVCQQIPLPVQYLDIFQKGKTLFWSTVSEINNSHFRIEASNNGIVWFELGDTASTSIANSGSNYRFDIEDSHIQYIRLHQVDFDGKENESEIIKWNSFNSQNSISKTILIQEGENIDLMQYGIGENGIIIDFSGKIIHSNIDNRIQNITLPTGQYFALNSTMNPNQSKPLRIIVL